MFYLAYGPGPRIMSTSWTEFDVVPPAMGLEHTKNTLPEFSDRLTWSHYRALMRVDRTDARDYYEKESISGSWTVRQLERQIRSHSFDRLVATQEKHGGMSRSDRPLIPSVSEVTACAGRSLRTV